MAHTTLDREATHEESVLGSRFIGYVVTVDSPAGASAHLAEIRAAHPSATHHCWAYRVGDVQRFSDDGEPGGTAGRPMLEVILKRDLDHVSAVVVRYYGGRKLGAGGLVRAYSGTLAKTLDRAGTREVVDVASFVVSAPFAYTDLLMRLLDEFSLRLSPFERSAPAFDENGPRVVVTLPAGAEDELTRALVEATNGAAELLPAPGSATG